MAWSPVGTLLATAGDDRSIKFWSPDGVLSRNIENLHGPITSLVFTADSSELLYTAYGGAAVLRVASGEERVRFPKQDNIVYSGAISPKGTLAATTAGNFNEIDVWNLADASARHRLVGKGKPNWSAGWSPDGKQIAWGNTAIYTASNDRGPLERSFSLTKLEFSSAPDAGFRRAARSFAALASSGSPAEPALRSCSKTLCSRRSLHPGLTKRFDASAS